MGGCVAQDRNDKIDGIENRHNEVFFFNYPETIVDVQHKLSDAVVPLTPNAVSYYKFCL
jgi:hypothetical protein